MNFELPAANNLDFTPASPAIDMHDTVAAETIVMTAILEGAGTLGHQQTTESGLRFIRYLLSMSRSARQGRLPNFKNLKAVQILAGEFIDQCGGPSKALRVLYRLKSTQP